MKRRLGKLVRIAGYWALIYVVVTTFQDKCPYIHPVLSSLLQFIYAILSISVYIEIEEAINEGREV